jgi:hypothetical protein
MDLDGHSGGHPERSYFNATTSIGGCAWCTLNARRHLRRTRVEPGKGAEDDGVV